MLLARPTIAAMTGYAPGEQPASGTRIVKLNTNENPYPPSPAVMAAIAAVAPGALQRYPDPVANEFRDVAAARHGVKRENILAGNGSDDILTIAIRTFVAPGTTIAYPDPTYSLYPVLAKLQDARVVEVSWRDGWALPSDALIAAAPSLTFVANPNSPSGTFVDPAELAELATKVPGVLLVDEAYADFAGDDCVRLVADHPNVIVSRSLSKGYALAGLRFGYCIADAALVEQMLKVKDSYNTDAISIAAATAALRDADYAEQTWADVRNERERMATELARLGFDVLPSRANFLLATTPPTANAERLYDQLKQRGILIRWFDTPHLADKLRITIGTPAENASVLEALTGAMGNEY
ncbi:MAG: histidinol-phosphate transaminase [Planctomycetota bacterium]